MSTAISSDSEGMSQPEVATVSKAIKNKKRTQKKRAHKRRREALKKKARSWNTTKGLLCCCRYFFVKKTKLISQKSSKIFPNTRFFVVK